MQILCAMVIMMSHDDITAWKHFLRYWPLWGESAGHRWIPLSKGHSHGLWDVLLAVVILSQTCDLMTRFTLQWRHNEHTGVSNHQHHNCLFNCLFRRRSKKTSKLCATGLCGGNSTVADGFHAQMASNAENVSIWRRHHEMKVLDELKYISDN